MGYSTLIRSDSGIAYRIDSRHAEEVRSALNLREKLGDSTGYVLHQVPVYFGREGGVSITADVYIGNTDHPIYKATKKDLKIIAKDVFHAQGKSGENKGYDAETCCGSNYLRYLYQLAFELRKISPNGADRHLNDLEMEVRSLEIQLSEYSSGSARVAENFE